MFSWLKKRKKKDNIAQTGANHVAIQNSSVTVTKNTPSARIRHTASTKRNDFHSDLTNPMNPVSPLNPINQASFYEDDSNKHSSSSHNDSYSSSSSSSYDSSSSSSSSSSDSYSGGSDW